MGTYKFLRERCIKGLICHYYMYPFEIMSRLMFSALSRRFWLMDLCPMSEKFDELDFDILFKI